MLAAARASRKKRSRADSSPRYRSLALVAIASQDGLLDSPKHRVLDFFDRRNIANVDDRKEAITVQSLLDMTSGIEWSMPNSMFEMERSPDWVKFVLDRPMSSAPGDVFNYSNGNAHLLSAIVTKLTGMSALEYAKAKLFSPLEINDVFWEHDPQGISNGGKGMYLQPRDMAKIGYLYLHNGAWERTQLLPSAWIDKVTHATIDPHAPGEPELRYCTFSGFSQTSMPTRRPGIMGR
jgi:CubicO group peptidase (beta-lactamase class C family)